jgi:hypothetical protein
VNVVAEMTIRALGAQETNALDHYAHALRAACSSEPPPFGTQRYGDIYRTVASDPAWIAVSLITSAEREADGATRLWSLAACTPDEEISACVKQHAIDEARHSRWYIALLDVAFPGAVEQPVRVHLDNLSPDYTAKMTPAPVEGSPFAYAVTVDDLIQSNIAEIRTSINQRLQRPVLLAHCDPSRHAKLTPLLDRLIRDEVRHIAYTARLIERFAKQDGDDYVIDLMTERVRDFNEITCEEVEGGVFPLHCSREECRITGACGRATASTPEPVPAAAP